MTTGAEIGRRSVLAAGFCLAGAGRLLAKGAPVRRPLAFEIWRNGQKIGSHSVSFRGDDDDFVVGVQAEMLVKFGPVPVFRYHHQASETWRGGKFVSFETHTVSNGRKEHVSASRSADSVAVITSEGRLIQAPANAHPLTHWNAAVLEGPVFNPQTGLLTHEQVVRSPGESVRLADGQSIPATRYSLTGDADISDWYDADNVWTALRAKAPDGSYIDYRRAA